MIEETYSKKYYCDITGSQLFEYPDAEMDESITDYDPFRLGAIIEFNSSYNGITDGEQCTFVIPHWLAQEFLDRIEEEQKKFKSKSN